VHPLAEDGWLRLTGMRDEEELRTFGAVPRSLHGGEAACLAIALRRGWTLVTDDRAVRVEAAGLEVRVSGSIGCLVMAVERGLCSVA
jgi:predicted nucleic acid-binding protein